MESSLIYKIALSKIPSVGAVTAKNLINFFGNARAVFEAEKKDLMYVPRVTSTVAKSILSKTALQQAEAELKFIDLNKIQVLYFEDANYPYRLRNLNDSPVVLYYKGSSDLNHKRIVSIVGTRRPTERGKVNCEALVEGLKNYNVLILSGLAYGIDIAAHKKCIDLGIETIAVLGHGLHKIYPALHRSTALKMIDHGGLLSEYPSDKGPDREHFPMRNRIVAGLCDALIVVETGRKGGSMITAEFANHYNRDVFAFPGRINDQQSQGCNHLIKIHKAALIEHAADIGYIMRWEPQRSPKLIQQNLFPDLSEQERNILHILNKAEDTSIDKLTYSAKLSSSQLASLLLNLEFKGLVKTLPGQRYMLV